jgi:hypothetical protein
LNFFVYLWEQFLKQLSSLLKISVSFLLIFSFLPASGGDPYLHPPGAAEAGMGNVCITHNGFWSSFQNQAILTDIKSLSLGFNYENRFGIPELGTRSAGIIIPTGKTVLSSVYSHFGYSDFKRDMTALGCGMMLSKKLAAGIQIDYISEKSAGEYNHYQTLTCEAGLLLNIGENTRLGIHFFNPVPNSLRKSFLPSSIRTGIGTYLNKYLFTGLEAEMNSESKLIIRTGLEFEAAKKLLLRGGFCTEYNSFSFGLGYREKFFGLDIGFVTHDKLGITSSAALIFNIK